MKMYSTGEVMCRRTIDGMDSEDWVPAHVAQGLYDALKDALDNYGAWRMDCIDFDRYAAALAAADGEES